MIAVPDEPLEHIVLPNVSWKTFDRLIDEMGKVRYQDGYLEFMKLGLGHNRCVRMIGHLIFMTAFETNTPMRSGGSTTLKHRSQQVCIEPDECFWFKHEREMRRQKQWDARRNPPPDLAVEVDVKGGALDRLDIYAKLKVPEVWRFDGTTFKVLVLGANGRYKERTKSLAFPALEMDGFVRFVKKLGSTEEVGLLQEFTEWVRSDAVTKKASGERKNGRL